MYEIIGEVEEAGKGPFEIRVYDFIPRLEPPKCFDNVDKMDPLDYFITSGDAVRKAEYLIDKLYSYAGTVRSELNDMKTKYKNAQEFEKKCWEAAGGAQKLLNALLTARGDAVFLEVEWDDHILLCTSKNPRGRKKKKKKEKEKKKKKKK